MTTRQQHGGTTTPLRRRATMATLITALWLLSSATVASPSADLDLVLVQVLHRHGARSALVPVNMSIICPSNGCGMLNDQGKDMLVKQGQYLAGRYNGSRPEITSVSYFASVGDPAGQSYNPAVTYSRSTDLSRTLQSADGLLKGLFANATEYFPAVHTVQFLQDELLLIDVSPSYHIYSTFYASEYNARLGEYARTLFPMEAVATMAAELHLDGYCAIEANYGQCILAMQDTAATRNAEGRLNDTPTVALYFSELNNCRRTFNSFFFPFNASDTLQAKRGSLGQNIAQRMLQNMEAAMTPDSTNTTNMLGKRLMHYSAHDTTLMPFAATIGNADHMLPLFGLMYVIDLLKNRSSGDFVVRLASSLPGQAPDTNHAVTESVLPLYCTSPNGTTYVVQDITGTCPFEDFKRFINATLPTDEAGSCFVERNTLEALNCTQAGVAPDPRSLCYFYRSYCPLYACRGVSTPAGTVAMLSIADYSCAVVTPIANGFTEGAAAGSSVSTGVVTVVALSCAALGILLGVLAVKHAAPCRPSSDKYTPIDKRE